jgi:hypothetical protein
VSRLRDYEEWHKAYDDPGSGLSWRLQAVQRFLGEALDRHPGPIRVLSLCAGDGRDLLGVLLQRHDAGRVKATLIELHPDIAQRARLAAAAAGLARVDVRTADAGNMDSYEGAVPADVVIMVGVLGNISDADVERTIKTAPQFCGPGATLLWSRSRGDGDDRNDDVRSGFAAAGFVELDYVSQETEGSRPALGATRYDGGPQSLTAGGQLFTFCRRLRQFSASADGRATFASELSGPVCRVSRLEMGAAVMPSVAVEAGVAVSVLDYSSSSSSSSSWPSVGSRSSRSRPSSAGSMNE